MDYSDARSTRYTFFVKSQHSQKFVWPLFLGTTPFNWTWNSWTKSKWTFMNIAFWWKCSILRVAWICKFIVLISLLFPAEQQQKQTEIAICSQNCEVCNWLLIFAIDFWHFQLSLLKAHDSLQQSELENICKKFLENFSNWLSASNWL